MKLHTMPSIWSTAKALLKLQTDMKTTFIYFVLFVLASCNNKREVHDQPAPKASEPDNVIMLSESQIRLGNITTETASKKNVGPAIVINGTVVVDQRKSTSVNSRAKGRIEKLFIKETGVSVSKGDPLYVLYSETLLTLQQEYLLAKEQYELLGNSETRYKSFFEASERKLLLYGLSKFQIGQLSKNSITARITFLSPASGIVGEIKVDEGQYVDEGTSLYAIEDVASLWVEAELYPGESSLVRRGDKIVVKLSGFESSPIETNVDFVSPEYRANSQILIIRAKIENRKLLFKPGQQAQVLFTHSLKESISVPKDAVIRDRRGAHVYVKTGHTIFRPRMVKIGAEGLDQVEITEGLNEGDTVAITGAYLLYSELVLKKGGDPMAGHVH
jgi:membrane fusion protein, copper/silver efflux system